MNAEETSRERSDSAPQAEQAEENHSERINSEKTLVEAVVSALA